MALCTLRRPHQLDHSGEAKAALAGERRRLQQRALLVTRAGKADPDLMAAENGILAFCRRVLLIEDLALPAAGRRGVAAKVIEECVAAENAAVMQQHDPGQAAFDPVEHPDV